MKVVIVFGGALGKSPPGPEEPPLLLRSSFGNLLLPGPLPVPLSLLLPPTLIITVNPLEICTKF